MSNLTLVSDALRLIGVLPGTTEADADDGNLALRLATEMVEEWADDGIVVSWPPNPTLDDDCSLTGTELNAVKYSLAVMLCPHYGRAATADLVNLASKAFARLQRIQMVRSLEPSDPILPREEGYRGLYDINTGLIR